MARLDDDMPALATPVLFLWGDADAFAPPSVGEALIPRMRDARLEIIKQTGHLPHVHAPTKWRNARPVFCDSISTTKPMQLTRSVISRL
jgi:pimeloyl-ACP methyl ester carboxylesterase